MLLRYLYTLIFYLLVPLVLLRLAWRGIQAPAYWQRWAERFGFFPPLPKQRSVWIHAVSVGEVQAAIPLIHALRNRFPHIAILVTTMTPTGSQRVKDALHDQVAHVYLPYDLPDAIARFFARTQPRLLILMETELWPNLLFACQQRKIPVILANARLSARSAKGYQRIAYLTKTLLSCLSVIAAQTEADAHRFITLGAKTTQVSVTGNIKFDCCLPVNLMEHAKTLRFPWKDRLVWIAASTHEGEEELILMAFAQVKLQFSQLLLILVPRHPERFNRVANLCLQKNYTLARRSEKQLCTATTDIYLGDTMGELWLLYAASDIAFVGGSLVSVGGHNLLEPAALGLPILTGSYMFNFAEITEKLLEARAIQQISDVKQLAEALKICLSDANLQKQMGKKAQQFVDHNRGATERLMMFINPYLVD